MRKYDVTIRATIQKTIPVYAENEKIAAEKAHSLFSCLNDEYAERYEEDTVSVKRRI